MEDYDHFIQHRLSLLRKTEENHRRPSSSLIRFYERAILPPLLSQDQREEMQNHQNHLKRDADLRKMTPNHEKITSEPRKITPDPEEITTDPEEITSDPEEITTDPEKITSDHNEITSDPKEITFKPKKITVDHNEITSKQEVTYDLKEITCDQRMALVQTILHSVQLRTTPTLEELLRESEESSADPDRQGTHTAFSPSDASLRRTDLEGQDADPRQCHAASTPLCQNQPKTQTQFLSPGSLTPANGGNSSSISGLFASGGFFLLSPSDSSGRQSNVLLSYPPIDGDELERSGQHTCCSAASAHAGLTAGRTSGEEHLDQAQPEGPHPKLQEPEGEQDLVSEQSVLSLDPVFSSSPCSPTIQNQPDFIETLQDLEPSLDPVPLEPDRLSLQALLKKSQDYRRRQRALRSQTRTSRSQQQSRVRAEEQNLSDKENQELPEEDQRAECRRSREGRSTTSSSSPAQRDQNSKTDLILKTGSGRTRRQGEVQNRRSDEEETTFRNNQLNLRANQDQNSSFICLSGPGSDVPDLSNSSSTGRYRRVPVPDFCKSPVLFQSRPGLRRGAAIKREETSTFNPCLHRDIGLPGTVLGRYDGSSSIDLQAEGGRTGSDQNSLEELESNLSSLKALISDLRSTVQQNLDHRNQTQRESTTSPTRPDEDWESNNRRSFNTSQSVLEGSGPDLRGSESIPLRVQQGAPLVVPGGVPTEVLPPGTSCISAAQWRRVPDPFRHLPAKSSIPVLPESSKSAGGGSDTVRYRTLYQDAIHNQSLNPSLNPSLNQSYDVDSPSGLWFHGGFNVLLQSPPSQQNQLTPDSGGEGQGAATKVKRRLLMHLMEESQETRGGAAGGGGAGGAVASSCGAHVSQREEQLKRSHAAQVRALQEEHRRQQEELLQRKEVLRREEVMLREEVQVISGRSSLIFSSSGSCYRDMLTSAPPQLSSFLSELCRPLLVAAVKGFLTRRLLRTERVEDLIRTVRDTRHFLNSEGNFNSRQDALLQERVSLQLRAARYEVYDIFFSLSAAQRMAIISRDRQLRQSREQSERAAPRGKTTLSAATQKSLERKRGVLIQKEEKSSRPGTRSSTRTRTRTRSRTRTKPPGQTTHRTSSRARTSSCTSSSSSRPR